MKKSFATLLALTMVLTLCLTGCGGGKRVVNVCGWGENIDEDLIRQFEEETGIHVNYQTAESNETMYSLINQRLHDRPDDLRGAAGEAGLQQHPQF